MVSCKKYMETADRVNVVTANASSANTSTDKY